MKSSELEAISKMYAREKKARKEAERILEVKSNELYELNKRLFNLNSNLESEVETRMLEITKQENKYQGILDSVNDIIYKTNAEGILTYINPLAEKITEYTVDELLNMKFTKLISRQDKKTVDEFYLKQFKNREKSTQKT